MNIYYLFSSITFLQFYIPLVIEATKFGYENVFIIRQNYKKYANPYSNKNRVILNHYVKRYDIKILERRNCIMDDIKGVVFMIDGDIYGPPRETALKESLLFTLNPDTTFKLSMTEHMNFMASYHAYIDHVDQCVFSNKHIIDQFNTIENDIHISEDIILSKDNTFNHSKNIFLGNTKFDQIPSKKGIYSYFKLNPIKQYCLFLYPKMREHFQPQHILHIYSHLKQLGFTIIVKTRPKDKPLEKQLQGDIFVCSDIFPNESLLLMKISQLCIISSSSANEETIFSSIPCIDLISDLRNYERNQYLLDDKVYLRIENDVWKDISFTEFKDRYENLLEKNSSYFEFLKQQYLYTHTNTSERIFKYIRKNKYQYLK